MQYFDTKVQWLKHNVLCEVAKLAWEGELTAQNVLDIPFHIVPGKKPTMRCCVYKERAILSERVKLALPSEGGHIIEVIDIACEECPIGGYEVTNACRGCLTHRCEQACKFDAIVFDQYHVAHIDKSKCKECGACAKVCPYSAIRDNKRPCEQACKVKAIKMSADYSAQINYDKCIACGACMRGCPFGAISDRSNIVEVIELLKDPTLPVVAVVAPAICSQFTYAQLGQVVSAIKKLGFHSVVEAALGADLVAHSEAQELAEKGFLTSSCCPAFVSYIKKNVPALVDKISHNLSPMASIARFIKEQMPCRMVFIGPCTAKKEEVQLPSVRAYVDSALTFEELQALFESKDINVAHLPLSVMDNASYFGRGFAKSGGVAEAVVQSAKEQGLPIEVKPMVCDGIEACKIALLRASKGNIDANFIEGMACLGGCIGGAGCLTHSEKNKVAVATHSKDAAAKTISEALDALHKQ